MGKFADLYMDKEAHLIEDKIDELDQRMEIALRESGMLLEEYGRYRDEYYCTLSKPTISQKGMAATYNSFNDISWEDMGYDLKTHRVTSGKIGPGAYGKAIYAAYELSRLYIDGFSMMISDYGPCSSLEIDCVGWLNYLFHEKWELKNRDPWPIYEKMHETGWRFAKYQDVEWNYNFTDIIGFIGYLSVLSVQKGTSEVEDCFLRDFDDEKQGNWLSEIKTIVANYRSKCPESDDEKIRRLMEPLQIKATGGALRSYWDTKPDEIIGMFVIRTYMVGGLPIVIKALSEIFEIEFWKLWQEYKHLPHNLQTLVETKAEPITPISTECMFRVSTDDLIIRGLRAETDTVSNETQEWFAELKRRYDELIAEEEFLFDHEQWIHELMTFADEAYYKVYAYTDFLKETKAYLNDRRYLAAWKLFEEMLHDPKMLEDVEPLFTPKTERKRYGFFAGDRESQRRELVNGWRTELDLKDNIARKKLRRYMALLDNRELRAKVLGF